MYKIFGIILIVGGILLSWKALIAILGIAMLFIGIDYWCNGAYSEFTFNNLREDWDVFEEGDIFESRYEDVDDL